MDLRGGLLVLTFVSIFAISPAQHSYPFANFLKQMQGKGDLIAEYLEPLVPEESADELYELAEILDSRVIDEYADDEEEDGPNSFNGTACAICRRIMGALKGIAAVYEWEEVRDEVVQFCHFLFTNLTDEYVNTDVLCPGIIDIQGPHVYELLLPKHRKSPEDICRNLNMCFPPKQDGGSRDYRIKAKRVNRPLKTRYELRTLEERKANALKIVQMADIHIEPLYTEGTNTDCGLDVCCIERYGEGDAGLYGGYHCNIPQRTMELFLHKAVELDSAFVIFSGDTPPHKMWDETYSSQLNCTDILIEAAERIFGSTKAYPNIGNHEMYPTNLFSIEFLEPYTQDMANSFANGWTNIAGFGPEQQETMRLGGFYTMQALPGLRIISFNTNYWYSFNFYNTLMEGGPEWQIVKNFLIDSFALAAANNEKVLLVGHHPPAGGDVLILQTREFENLIANYSDIIVLHVAGHTHNDHFRILRNNENTPISMTYINPSVTTKTDKNPSMRVFYIDNTTYEVIDYEQYGFDLMQAAGSAEPPEIAFWYSAMAEYVLADMSPASWQDLIERMNTDQDLMSQYYYNFGTRFNDNLVCNGTCKTVQLCSLSFYSFDDYTYCVADWDEIMAPALEEALEEKKSELSQTLENVIQLVKEAMKNGMTKISNFINKHT